MDGKLTILLLLAAAAQSSLAQNTSKSCVGSTTTIASDLAKITYGEETSTNGLRTMADANYKVIISILTDHKRHIRPKNADVRLQLAKDKAYQGLVSGIGPTIKAVQVFQTETDVAKIVNRYTLVAQAGIRYIFSAINRTMVATNYTASKAELAKDTAILMEIGSTLIEGLYGTLLAGKKTIPAAAAPVITCLAQKAKSHIGAGIQGTADQIAILLDAIFNIGTEDAEERIRDIQEEARTAFDTEVRYKYSIIRNLVVGEYLRNSRDIVTGLFDIQSTIPGYTSI